MDLIFYDGAHSVTFGEKNSWTDWHLIPSSKPVISPPSIKVKQVDIPGVHGMLDLTTVLTGYPLYSNRTGSLDFILAPGFEYWENAKAVIMRYLHGKTMNMYLADDLDHYYTGFFSINSLKSDAATNGLTIDYNLHPFRREVVASDEPWKWDLFNFETGVIRNWSSLEVDGSLEIVVSDCEEPTMITVKPTAQMTMVHEYENYDGSTTSKSYSLTANQNFTGASMRPGTNTFTFTGNGSVRFHYRGGVL